MGVGLTVAGWAQAADQVWSDANIDNTWSTNALNWDAGVEWLNGNSAVFSGGGSTVAGETVDVSNAVIVAGMTFQTNGYVIADADANGSLTLTGTPAISVVNAGDTGTVSEVIAGSGGLTKNGPGVLLLAATNTYSGETRVEQGVLRMGPRCPSALGAAGAGNGTVVLPGAALDINGATPNGVNSTEPIFLSGSGPDGLGALINRGAGCLNSGFTGGVTLQGDTTVGSYSRIDVRSAWSGGGNTLTKTGGSEFAVGNAVNNCRIVINSGNYTYMYATALGGADFDTTLNGGALRSYGDYTVNESLICNGGSLVAAGGGTNLFKFVGPITLNGQVGVWGENNNMTVELAGLMEGPGGFTRSGNGSVYLTGSSNTYSGATIVNATLYLGRTNQAAGVFGVGPVTNTSNVYIDRAGAFLNKAGFFGNGRVAVRYGAEMIMADCLSSNAYVQVGNGALTLSNGASMTVYGQLSIADRQSSIYSPDPSNVVAALTVLDGASLTANAISIGNGSGGSMTGIVTQIGGDVRTTGYTGDPVNFPDEYDGLHLAHWPSAYSEWNMRGGTLIVDNGYRLAIAIDGRGWLRQTGGEVYATTVMVNARTGGGGYGRLTLEDGLLNVGSNGITAGVGAPYLVEYGGAGGIVRASTNFVSPLKATLYGTCENAITFDTQEWMITLTNILSGAGGFNKTGSGVLTLGGHNSFSGGTYVAEGTLLLNVANALTNSLVTVAAGAVVDLGGLSQELGGMGGNGVVSNGLLAVAGNIAPGVDGIGTLTVTAVGAAAPGGTLTVDVTADGASDTLHATGDLSLSGMALQVVDTEQLQKGQVYTIITCDGELSGLFDEVSLPEPWFVLYDWEADTVQLRSERGTLIRVR